MMTCLTAFHPYAHGWHFNDRDLTQADVGLVEQAQLMIAGPGLSAGMVTVALDRYSSGLPPSRQRAFPIPDSELFGEFVRRQRELIDLNGLAIKYAEWISKPDHPGVLKPHTIGYETKRQWYGPIQSRLDGGYPVPIALVGSGGARGVCLAYGYELAGEGIVRLRVYDPRLTAFMTWADWWGCRHPLDEVTFNLEAAENQIDAHFGSGRIRGFFALNQPGPIRQAGIGGLAMPDFEHLGMDGSLHNGQLHRRDQVRMTVALSSSVVPYFNVLCSRQASPGESEYLTDADSHEKMNPHACQLLGSSQAVEFAVLQRGYYPDVAVPPLHLAVSLPGLRVDRTLSLPQPQVCIGVYLHEAAHASRETASDSPCDVRAEDVVVVEPDVSQDVVAALQERLVPVAVPPDPIEGNGQVVLAGFEHRYHLGYLHVPLWARAWTEWMIPPATLERNGQALPAAEWGSIALRGGFTRAEYEADLHAGQAFVGRDAAAIRATRFVQWWARALLDFTKPVYAELRHWEALESIKDRIVEHVDREFLKDLIVRLADEDRLWIEQHGSRFRRARRAEVLRSVDAAAKSGEGRRRLVQLARQCEALHLQVLASAPAGWRLAGGEAGGRAQIEAELLAEYRQLISRELALQIVESWRAEGTLAILVRRLRSG